MRKILMFKKEWEQEGTTSKSMLHNLNENAVTSLIFHIFSKDHKENEPVSLTKDSDTQNTEIFPPTAKRGKSENSFAIIKMSDIKDVRRCSTGCANINYFFKMCDTPYILRFYCRDAHAVFREAHLGKLWNDLKKDPSLKTLPPIPQTLYRGVIFNKNEDKDTFQVSCSTDMEVESFDTSCKIYPYAITTFLEGFLCRDILLDETVPQKEKEQIFQELGRTISLLSKIKCDTSQFVNDNFEPQPQPQPQPQSLIQFFENIIQSHEIKAHLDPVMIQEIEGFFETHRSYLKNFENDIYNVCNTEDETETHKNQPCFVHGDFDPSNILITKNNDYWKVSGILDMEFSFLGSSLWDVSTMLRYRHRLPASFIHSFIKGLTQEGITLPPQWESYISLLTILSLLDVLHRHKREDRPDQSSDIYQLIYDHLKS